MMENPCDDQELVFPSVFEVIGEPAIVIYGVPDVTPGGKTFTASNSESDDEPCFGDWLEGRKIRKLFGGQYYSGKVEKYDTETKWYRVVYEDGDFEDLEWHELEEVLLPLDISIPLKVLASARCTSEKSVSKSVTNLAKGRKNPTNSLRSKGETLELLQISQAGEPKDGKLMEENLRGRTHQGDLLMHSGLQPEYKETCFQMCKHDESLSTPEVYTTPSACKRQEFNSQPVFEVIGESAIVINDVPDVTPGCTPTILDAMDNPVPGDGPCFGKLLEGRKVQKLFGDRYYSGKVEKYDKETNWYRVVYEDGDFEDLEWRELEDVLVPLEISIPLTTLASRMCKSENSVSMPQIKLSGARKTQTNSLGCSEKTKELLHTSQVGEPRDEKLLETNVIERTHQGNLKMQQGVQIEKIETHLQMCQHEEYVSNPDEGTTTSKNSQNGEIMGNMSNMFQTPLRADINGDELVQADAYREPFVRESLKWRRNFQKQTGKTARAEKQRRTEKTFVQNSAYHPK